jgi:hypothetical protein
MLSRSSPSMRVITSKMSKSSLPMLPTCTLRSFREVGSAAAAARLCSSMLWPFLAEEFRYFFNAESPQSCRLPFTAVEKQVPWRLLLRGVVVSPSLRLRNKFLGDISFGELQTGGFGSCYREVALFFTTVAADPFLAEEFHFTVVVYFTAEDTTISSMSTRRWTGCSLSDESQLPTSPISIFVAFSHKACFFRQTSALPAS